MMGTSLLDDHQQADGDEDDRERRLAHHAPHDQALEAGGDERHADHRRDQRETEADLPLDRELVGEIGAQQDEPSLGEVERAGGLVDHHEAQGDEPVDRPGGDPREEELDELGHDRLLARGTEVPRHGASAGVPR